jgi:hypothetical protein
MASGGVGGARVARGVDGTLNSETRLPFRQQQSIFIRNAELAAKMMRDDVAAGVSSREEKSVSAVGPAPKDQC